MLQAWDGKRGSAGWRWRPCNANDLAMVRNSSADLELDRSSVKVTHRKNLLVLE